MEAETVKKIEVLNETCRAEEIRARNYAKFLKEKLKTGKSAGLVDDFGISVELRVFSDDEELCKSRNAEPGDSLFGPFELGFSLHLDDEEFFATNGNEFATADGHPLQNLRFGYLMHCLVFHSGLSFEDLSKIDDVWIDVVADYNFSTKYR